jgi:predicted regulator of Ras-like GTPase activity (Roadblock/LC7/MglB family)
MADSENAKVLLKELADITSVKAAILISEDGLPLEKVAGEPTVNADEVAALARDGAFHIRKMLKDLGGARFVQAVIEHTNGSLLFANLPYGVTLVVLVGKGSNKGEIWNAVVARFPRLIKSI